MTSKDDIIRMAREAGFDLDGMPNMLYTVRGNYAQLERFAELVRADERGQCAKVCEELFADVPPYSAPDCASAIRARGQQA